MKKSKLLNSEISFAISHMRHTDTIVVRAELTLQNV